MLGEEKKFLKSSTPRYYFYIIVKNFVLWESDLYERDTVKVKNTYKLTKYGP